MLPTPSITNLNENVYEPSEDSFLLLDCLEAQKPYLQQKFLHKVPLVTEIGAGSGIVTSFIMEHIVSNGIYFATDINPHSCKSVFETISHNVSQKKPFDCCQMSLTTAIRRQSIDLMVFNPPYVPADEVPKVPECDQDPTWLDLALLGGDDGMAVTWVLLNELDNIISESGVVYVLFCARNKPEMVAEIMRERGWDVEMVIGRKAGWEVLSVMRLTRSLVKT